MLPTWLSMQNLLLVITAVEMRKMLKLVLGIQAGLTAVGMAADGCSSLSSYLLLTHGDGYATSWPHHSMTIVMTITKRNTFSHFWQPCSVY